MFKQGVWGLKRVRFLVFCIRLTIESTTVFSYSLTFFLGLT